MRNTFSRSFRLDDATEKKFYFIPVLSGAELSYKVHINRDPELKKFKVVKQEGTWKVELQSVKFPEWLFTLEPQFNISIEEAVASEK